MKKQLIVLLSAAVVLCMLLTGCGNNAGTTDAQPAQDTQTSVQQNATATQSSGDAPDDQQNGTATQSDADSTDEMAAAELTVRFGDEGEAFQMRLEDNATAAAIARYVGTTDWRLPIYNYDESEVMQYYDVPSRYEIPDNSETVTQAKAGDVFYSDPNRIVLYYHDAEISEEYTKIGTFDATEEFISAVENNPVLEGWGNKIVCISAGE